MFSIANRIDDEFTKRKTVSFQLKSKHQSVLLHAGGSNKVGGYGTAASLADSLFLISNQTALTQLRRQTSQSQRYLKMKLVQNVSEFFRNLFIFCLRKRRTKGTPAKSSGTAIRETIRETIRKW